MAQIANTGERILLEKETPLMIARHFCAYKFTGQFVSGKNVLDIGCGEGYGSNFLADLAKQVLGLDYNAEVIAYAQGKYQKENLRFICLDVDNLSDLTQKFDLICSFQNIEHIRNADKLLNNINNLLEDKGLFICSTCNMKDASPGRDEPFNKFHVREYLAEEFQGLLNKHFKEVRMFGLKRGLWLRLCRRLKKIGLFNLLPNRLDPVKNFYAKATYKNFYFTHQDLDSCLDFIAVCRKA